MHHYDLVHIEQYAPLIDITFKKLMSRMRKVAPDLRIMFCFCPTYRVRRDFEELKRLWRERQRALKRQMIFATINVVKQWDLKQVSRFDERKLSFMYFVF